ncbi:MMPL family transporter [Solilutibacter silvestris]|uniref:MMPL family transporter n=1 Tax=Solilutibacter silvestris TaxID=1645665 RepID=UPI003D342BC0
MSPSRTLSIRQRVALALAWLAVLAVLGWMVARQLHPSGDLREFMPKGQTPMQRLVLDELGEGPGSRLLLVAISGKPDEDLAELSKGLTAKLKSDPRYSQVVNGSFDAGALDSKLLPYRYLLSPTLDTQKFDAPFLADQLQQRVADLGSPAAGMLEPLLPRDPTLEMLKLAERWTPPNMPPVVDGVWVAPGDGALLLVQTRAPGFDPAAQEQAIAGIESALRALPGGKDAKLTLSGPGYFSVIMSKQTKSQADRIGFVSSIGFILLLLLAYRSVGSLLLAGLPVVSGALAGIVALTLWFPQVHGITLAFGFTLLGVAQEYPIRVLSHRRAGEDALASVRGLWPLLLTAIASACIAYLAFYASGVGGLQQLAVFTITGLLVAGFSTRYLLPWLLPVRVRDVESMPWLVRARHLADTLPRPRWLPWLVAIATVAMIALAPGKFWQNDLSALTPLPHDLLQRDAHLRAALGAPDVRYLLVLQAADSDGVLKLSERLEPQVEALQQAKALDGAELPSRYLPSMEIQRARQQALPDRATLQAALAQAQRDLPFKPDSFSPFVDDVETARALPLLDAQRFAGNPLGERLGAMLRNRDGKVLGLVTLNGVHDPAAVQRLATDSGGAVQLLDLKDSAESLLVGYRTRILQALLVATLLLIATITFALRSPRRAWHVLAPMTLATFLVLAVERVAGIEISLFHLVALILAAGLGLHYALFFERETGDPAEQRRTLHATIVCVLSALLVFGMLALSSIPVLRAIGLTVALGVLFHFCLSILMAPHVGGDEA